MAPVRTCLLIDDLEGAGGTEHHLLDLLESIDRDRIFPEMIVLGRAGLADRVRALGVPVQAFGVRSLRGLEGLRTVTRLSRAFKRSHAELVVTYHAASDLVGPLAARMADARTISCRRDLGLGRGSWRRALQRPVNTLVDGMIAVSHAVRQAVTRGEGFEPHRISVIPNGCDSGVFRPRGRGKRRELGLPEGAVVVGTLANFRPIKGYDVVMRVALEILPAMPDVRFLLVGGAKGDEAARHLDRYQAMARPAADRIVFAGARQDVPEVLSCMDVFLQASYSEGFANSILQAMACGLPVVATDVGGNPELVDRATGILVPAGDPIPVVGALRLLLGDRALRQRMGDEGRHRAVERFSLGRMVERYEDAFESAVSRGGFRPHRPPVDCTRTRSDRVDRAPLALVASPGPSDLDPRRMPRLAHRDSPMAFFRRFLAKMDGP